MFMVRVRYIPLADPQGEVERLRPTYDILAEWRGRYGPGTEQYWAIVEARGALDKVAQALTGAKLYEPPPAHSTPKA